MGRFLVKEAGCNPNIREKITSWTSEEKTPLMLAAMYSASESISCLLEVGADPNLISQPGDTTALSCAVTSSRDLKPVKILSSVTTAGLKTVLLKLAVSQIM